VHALAGVSSLAQHKLKRENHFGSSLCFYSRIKIPLLLSPRADKKTLVGSWATPIYITKVEKLVPGDLGRPELDEDFLGHLLA
jgi:hypothetical protein